MPRPACLRAGLPAGCIQASASKAKATSRWPLFGLGVTRASIGHCAGRDGPPPIATSVRRFSSALQFGASVGSTRG